ncbi:MAG: symmetrical bis(5'-nucleosyl)-tetraphosphatase [Nevskia sp.]
MSTYAVGDVQGCLEALQRLLDRLAFDPARDRLWLSGDLVNRGPDSLGTLRFVRSLGAAAVTVLGNHDLHLLAVAHGGKPGRRDTLTEVLAAPDRDELLDWLRARPLLHRSPDGRWQMLHAGLPPQWSIDDAEAHAREAEAALRGDDHGELLRRMYGDQPDQWDSALRGIPRLRFIINSFTRLRYCSLDGRIDPDSKGMPGSQPRGLVPWFAVPGRRSADQNILFGHWSTLGRVHWPEHRVWGLDTGCVWGAQLSALCLETGQVQAVDCAQYRSPGGG